MDMCSASNFKSRCENDDDDDAMSVFELKALVEMRDVSNIKVNNFTWSFQ